MQTITPNPNHRSSMNRPHQTAHADLLFVWNERDVEFVAAMQLCYATTDHKMAWFFHIVPKYIFLVHKLGNSKMSFILIKMFYLHRHHLLNGIVILMN